ncbi:hypothetical protein ASE76_13915 [Xylophilus sp. Leaf220]|nr:hypothetical protein ASE76_13915 [Xylophilus sp. Leaf220]
MDFRALAEALLPHAETLVPQWLPGGKTTAGEYRVSSIWRSENTPSLSVRVSGVNAGKWADFGGDQKGNDLVSLYAAIHGLDNGKAALELARQHGLESVAGVKSTPGPASAPRPPPAPLPPAPPSATQHDGEKWNVITPVPAHAPEPTFWHFSRKETPAHIAAYRRDGDLFGYVVRFIKSDGGKETLPHTWCTSSRDNGSKWHWKVWDEPRPLYLPGGTSPGTRTVVLVEGEVKADVLQALLDAGAPGVYAVVSWSGGCKAWKKAEWSWLTGCTVLLWPDCDGKREKLTKAEEAACLDTEALAVARAAKPLLPAEKQGGMAAMLGIGAVLRDTHACNVQLLPIPQPLEVPDGWDCRDAIETDGWDFDRVLQLFAGARALLGTVAAAVPPLAASSKKIEGPATAADGDVAGDERMPWWLAPYWDDKKSRWHTSRKLVITALTHDIALDGVLGLNQLSNNIEARRPWPWLHGKAGPITSIVDLKLGEYLSKTYGLPSIPRVALSEAIETVAHRNHFHPVQEYLQRLAHDGRTRIDDWLVYVLGETPDSLAAPVREYLSLVGRYLLLGMVKRVMEPGCKFDYCPVLEGPGGLGKSTFVETLAGSAFFSDTPFDPGRGKEGQEQVQGLWVYEIAELAHFGKAEIGLIKAFITTKVDRYRPSYGRTVEAFERQCVLMGTTNEKTYLRDRTGNRRFWPIPVRNRLNIPWLIERRDQLFAEAYALYEAGEAYTPTHQDELRLFVPMQESRLVETAVLSEIQHLLTRPPAGTPETMTAKVNQLTEFITIAQLVAALGTDAAKSNAGLESQVRSWMDQEGWPRAKRQIHGVRAWGYERPKDWPPQDAADQVEKMAGTLPAADTEEADDAPF